jgi:hypothetical protein
MAIFLQHLAAFAVLPVSAGHALRHPLISQHQADYQDRYARTG